MAGLVDLDELALRCRDEQARSYIEEAVSCYKAGAFRSCIVSTWNAVVFDYLHKLRELEMSGDDNAKKRLEEFETIRHGGESKLKAALDFERELLNVATADFELLGPLEKEDLLRLQKDRSRCAHPSMQSVEEPYQPTAELARTHLRNAVEIMLSREPVQGKAVFDLICSEIKSPSFPKNPEDAQKYLSSGPLVRARKVLIRNLLIGITKSYLADSLPPEELTRQLAALIAIFRMYPVSGEEILGQNLVTILTSTSDENLQRLLRFVSRLPLLWDSLNWATRHRLQQYAKMVNHPALLQSLVYAIPFAPLKTEAAARLGDLSDEDFGKLVERMKDPLLVSHAIGRFLNAVSYVHAKQLIESIILPLATQMTPEDLRKALQAVHQNRQIAGAWGIPEALVGLYNDTAALRPNTTGDWQTMLSSVESIFGAAFVTDSFKVIADRMHEDALWPLPTPSVSEDNQTQ
jgi:hypothetical protein